MSRGFLERHFPEQMAQDLRVVQGMDAAAALLRDGKSSPRCRKSVSIASRKAALFRFRRSNTASMPPVRRLDEVQDVCCNFNFGRYRPIYASEDRPILLAGMPVAGRGLRHAASRFRTGEATRISIPSITMTPICMLRLASSDFDRCLAMVMDAAGEIGATSVYLLRRPRRSPAWRVIRSRQSLGIFYSLVTQFLGYAFNEDEYKVMGLASFGDPERYRAYFRSAIRLGPNGSVEIPCLTLNRGFAEGLFFTASAAALANGLGIDGKPARTRNAPTSARRCRTVSRKRCSISPTITSSRPGNQPAAERRLRRELRGDRRAADQRHVRANPCRLCIGR